MTNTTVVAFAPPTEQAIGGGLEGAERTSREMLRWTPPMISPDVQINAGKDLADARGRDIVQNDAYATGAVSLHRDSIVGNQYRLNAQPDYDVLGADEAWAEEFQQTVEPRFNLISDSIENWLDASGSNTLTGLIRLAVGGFLMTGEVVGTAEWLRDSGRPCSTAVQLISPTRLSNPNGQSDTRYLRRGVEIDVFGSPISYWFRTSHPGDVYADQDMWRWRNVPARKPWGRRMVIHILEKLQPEQTRGISDMVSALKQMRMTKKFQEITLQNAVVNASYAAAIESELPREVVFGALGAGTTGLGDALSTYMQSLAAYTGAAPNLSIDGTKIPHLFPGTKLNLTPMGTPGGVGTEFEQSLLRHTAASLGLSYEQFSRDYTKTNYSSARASMSETWKYMQSRKKIVADRLATHIYVLWLEEQINAGNVPLPPGMTVTDYYADAVKREALHACDWIGASRGQIDELKETQAAVARIDAGFSTIEKEAARLGEDFRKVFRQRSREKRLAESLGLAFGADAAMQLAKAQADAQQQQNQDQQQ